MSTNRYCRDCAHCLRSRIQTVPADALRMASCDALTKIDMVTGEAERSFCSNARDEFGACGVEAKLFQPKDLPLREQLVRSLEATPLIATVQ